MEIITVTGYDGSINGKVYLLNKDFNNIPKGKVYEILKNAKELYKAAEEENSEIEILSKKWCSGGSRRHPYSYCFSLYSIPLPDSVLGWSFLAWGHFRGRTFPSRKVEGVSRASELHKVPLQERSLDNFGVFVSKEETKILEDWCNRYIEKLFEDLKPVSAPKVETETGEDVRLKTALEKL